MAHTLKSFDFSKASDLTKAEKGNYDWDQWLNGDIWQLTQGEDFQPHPLMMERIIRTRATGRQAKIRLRHVPVNGDEFGIIVVQRHDIAGPSEIKRAQAREKRETTKKMKATVAVKKAPAKKAAKVTKPTSKTPSKRPVKKV